MNARLLARMMRQRPPAGGLRLLGEGVDAILVRMRAGGSIAPASPSADERLLRYLRARAIFASSPRDLKLLEMRSSTGDAYQRAWAQGRRPPLNTFPRRAGITTHRRTP